jgi:hypothetical protein
MKPMPLAGLVVPRFAWMLGADEPDDERPAEPSRWRTYQWAYRDTSNGMSPLMELRTRACIERELFDRKLLRSDPPEFTIAFFLARSHHIRAASLAGGAWAESSGDGALVVEICDARTLRTIWRGVAAQGVERDCASQAAIQDAVSTALRDLPPSVHEDGTAPCALDGPAYVSTS